MPASTNAPARRRLPGVGLGLAAGVLLGGLAALAALYEKPGRRYYEKFREILGRRENNADRFAFGYSPAHDHSWTAVRSPTNAQWNVRRGFDLELVAEGLDYPVNLAFVPEPGPDPDSPVVYVNELHGRVRYLGRDGRLHTFAEGLNNFPPIDDVKSDETGLSGLTLVPGSDDLIVTGAYRDPASGLLSNHVLRLVGEPGGKRMREAKVVLDLKEFTSPSNQIQQALIGPDGKLYVAVGDAENHQLSLDLARFGGKVLRMNLDGTACEDNPFYEEHDPESPRSYVYASGVRNVFDLDFEPDGRRLYAVDNGKNIDRFFEVVRGGSYGWDGDPESIRVNALYTWGPVLNTAPVGLTFLERAALGEGTAGRAYVAMYGPAAGVGANHGKSIVELTLDPKTGLLARAPETLLQYAGEAKATVLGLAEGPDGLYFTDFWGETTGVDDARGRIYKVVPSKATLGLPDVAEAALKDLPGEERGRVYFARNCTPCHTIDGVGGREGPQLSHVRSNLDHRLNSTAYDATLRGLLASDNPFLAEQRDRLREVRSAKGRDRIRLWLHHHLEEPRFDNLHGKMPGFALTLPAEQREAIIAYLMTRE